MPSTAWFVYASSGLVVATILIWMLAAVDGWRWLRVLAATSSGLLQADQIGIALSSADVAFAVWLLVLTGVLGFAHPALGFAVIVLARSWLDAYTYPIANTYFLWASAMLVMAVAVRTFLRREPIRLTGPGVLLLLFLGWAVWSAQTSYAFDRSYRALLDWGGFAMAFFVVVNSVRTPASKRIIGTAFALALGTQATWALLHFFYVLPAMREMLRDDPAVMQQYFGTSEATPELARRLNLQRAFGNMLFPNALGSFLTLGVPFALSRSVAAWQSYAEALYPARQANRKPLSDRERNAGILVAALVWLFFATIVFVVIQFPLMFSGPPPWYLDVYALLAYAAVAGVVPAVFAYGFVHRRGLHLFMKLTEALYYPALAIVTTSALVLTYSRGAWLGSVFAAVAALVVFRSPATPWFRRQLRVSHGGALRAAATVLVLLCVVLLGLLATTGGAAVAQGPAAEELPPEIQERMRQQKEVRVQGDWVTTQDLVNPQSFSLRIGYWQVAGLAFADNLWRGVGLGAFAIAYQKYQFIGAASVREAHASFLQVFAETGVLGGLLILAFWASLLIWSCRRILAMKSAQDRWLAIGLWTGLLAFLLHANIDITFSHPGLMLFGFCIAGLLIASCLGSTRNDGDSTTEDDAPGPGARALLAALAVIATGTVVWASYAPWIHAVAKADGAWVVANTEQPLTTRFRIAEILMLEAPRLAASGESGQIGLPLQDVYPFVPDLEALGSVGDFRVPRTTAAARAPGDPIPPNATWVVSKPEETRTALMPYLDQAIARLEAIDAAYPYDEVVAISLSKWHRLAVLTKPKGRPRFRHKDSMIDWAERAVVRSPEHALSYRNLGDILEDAAFRSLPARQEPLRERAVASYRKAAEVAGIRRLHFDDLGWGIWRLLRENPDIEGADALRAEMDAAFARGRELQEARNASPLYRP